MGAPGRSREAPGGSGAHWMGSRSVRQPPRGSGEVPDRLRSSGLEWEASGKRSTRAGSSGRPPGGDPCEPARVGGLQEAIRASGLEWEASGSRSTRAGSSGRSPGGDPCERARAGGLGEPIHASGLEWEASGRRSVRAGSSGRAPGGDPCERARVGGFREAIHASGLEWEAFRGLPRTPRRARPGPSRTPWSQNTSFSFVLRHLS
jgi:hypothetical protein